MSTRPAILFVDAYDSFSENIIALLSKLLHADVTSIKIDCDIENEYNLESRRFFHHFDAIVLGPGPGDPANSRDTGLFDSVWENAAIGQIPVLGICLGFQSLCLRYGFPVNRMDAPCHGHAKVVHHDNEDIFAGVGEVIATNYNSLAVRVKRREQDHSPSRPTSSRSSDSLMSLATTASETSSIDASCQEIRGTLTGGLLQILAWDNYGYVMAVKHATLPFWAVQFHPESCKSNDACHKVLQRWWLAAQKHNQHCRTDSCHETEQLTRLSRAATLQVHPAAPSRLLERLTALCSPATSSVQHRGISKNFERQQIAEFCKQLSEPGPTAMLESTKKGRFSIYPISHKFTWALEFRQGCCTLLQGGATHFQQILGRDEMLKVVERFVAERNVTTGPSSIPFWGGLLGFLSYELGTDTLSSEFQSSEAFRRNVPDISLMWVDRSVVYDHQEGRVIVQSLRNDDDGWVTDTLSRLSNLCPSAPRQHDCTAVHSILASTKIAPPDHGSYISKIRRCQSQLHAGNSYELCLTTEALITTPSGPSHPWLLYNKLQKHNPAPFAAYVSLNGTTILSSSPEQFLSWSRSIGTIDMVPMKGTVKKVPGLTLSDATSILSTPKETAENLMIADLIRHDLNATVGRPGSVEVAKLCEVVEHETVYQLVSHIRAHIPLPPSTSDQYFSLRRNTILTYGHKALRSTLPPGSMTGAPKKRSCEILSSLEQRHRGVYSGVIGFFDVGGGGCWSVCIRTAFSNAAADEDVAAGTQTWHVGAGGAITVLSDEEKEWEEMTTKLESVLGAFRA